VVLGWGFWGGWGGLRGLGVFFFFFFVGFFLNAISRQPPRISWRFPSAVPALEFPMDGGKAQHTCLSFSYLGASCGVRTLLQLSRVTFSEAILLWPCPPTKKRRPYTPPPFSFFRFTLSSLFFLPPMLYLAVPLPPPFPIDSRGLRGNPCRLKEIFL